MLIATGIAALMWVALLAVPWRPWSTRERITPLDGVADADFTDITVLIPARDEARSVAATLTAVAAQGRLGQIVLVDDQSSDGTGARARALALPNLTVLDGTAPPDGWSGKLWALHQGAALAKTPLILLLDADIELAPGMLAALRQRRDEADLALVSVMATLHMQTAWERLLLPPFIFFFKLLYPFALVNAARSRVAAAAGGCILIDSAKLRTVGGFEALHDAIIDDCTLARLVKQAGGRVWLGLSHGARAVRPYETLGNIWDMVARTAYTQLKYSPWLLAVCTVLLILSFAVPLAGLFSADAAVVSCAAAALGAMALAYLPTVRFYGLPAAWTATLPLAATLFLAMTWTSAARYWRGERSRWKQRSYERVAAPGRN